MRFQDGMKFDFKDVLLVPKRSTLSSRSEVSLIRNFKFLHTNIEWNGTPIIAANMDSSGTIEIAKVLSAHYCMTAFHKHYDSDTLVNFWKNESDDITNNTWYSIGIVEQDMQKLRLINSQLDETKRPKKICIDVANGYQQSFVDFIKRFREEFPDVVIMAGNVVTPEITEELILSGVSIVKIGIGPGCFIKGTMVETTNGKVPIENVKIGDTVLTHTLSWKKVINTFIHTHHKKGIKINNIKTTPNHEFYVLHKRFKDIVNDNNIHEYAEWIEAGKLNSNYLLLKNRYYLEEIKSVEYFDIDEPVYDLEVEKDHSYIVEDVIVHNSMCLTRKITGIGYPQLSSLIECSDAAHGLGGMICGDGGLTVPGDFAKLYSTGSDFSMVGGMFAGHDESGGEIITKRFITNELDENDEQIIETKYFKRAYGMSSKEAMNKYNGGLKEYRASEGKSVDIPYRGSINNTITEILGGIRSACTYTGSKNIKELPKRATFIQVSQQINEVFGKS
jgi:IMP dehydrogenase/GMP reductase